MCSEIERFLRLVGPKWSATTLQSYAGYLRSFYHWAVAGGIPIAAVTTEQLALWLEEHPQWGPQSRHLAIAALRGFFKWFGGPNPAAALTLPKREEEPQRTLTPDQVDKLLASFDTSRIAGVRNLALILLLLDTGLRASEVCLLSVDHLDLKDRSLQVRIKGGKVGRAIYSAYAASALDHWLGVRPEIARPDVRTVFVALGGVTPGRPLSRDGLRLMFRRMGEKARIGLISPHDFRRTFAVMSLRAGAPSRMVQVAGRWSSIDMVERYTKAITADDFAPYSPVNRIMGIGET